MPRALLVLPHQVARPSLEVRKRGRVLGADYEAEVVAVIRAALREVSALRLVGARIKEPRLGAVTGRPVALEVADVGGEGVGAEARALMAHGAHDLADEAPRAACRRSRVPGSLAHRRRPRLPAPWGALGLLAEHTPPASRRQLLGQRPTWSGAPHGLPISPARADQRFIKRHLSQQAIKAELRRSADRHDLVGDRGHERPVVTDQHQAQPLLLHHLTQQQHRLPLHDRVEA